MLNRGQSTLSRLCGCGLIDRAASIRKPSHNCHHISIQMSHKTHFSQWALSTSNQWEKQGQQTQIKTSLSTNKLQTTEIIQIDLRILHMGDYISNNRLLPVV